MVAARPRSLGRIPLNENHSLGALAPKIDHEAGFLETKERQVLKSKNEHETGSLEPQSLRFLFSCSFAPGTRGGVAGPGPRRAR